jgi:predicted transglutaminase-like cysteine proteinase
MKKLVLIILLSVVVNAKFISTTTDNSIVQKRIDFLNSSVEELKGLSALEQLKKVNAIFNNFIKYSDDVTVYGKRDYKAVIQETVATGRGDCDDYTLAKLQALLYLGFDIANIKVAISNEDGVIHMKLFVLVNNEIMVLDNLNKKVRKLTDLENKRTIRLVHGEVFQKFINDRLKTLK